MKKMIYLILILMLVAVKSWSQDRSRYAQYQLYPVLINPAYTGFSGDHNLLFNYRSSWAGFDNGNPPRDVTFSYDGKVLDRVGLGAMLVSQQIGSLQNYRAQLAYAYGFKAGDFDLSVGLTTEFLQTRLSNKAILDPFYDPGDPIFEEAVDGLQYFDAALGFYTDYQEKLFVGFTVPNLIRLRIDQATVPTQTESTALKYFALQLGYRFMVENYNFKVEPSLLVRRLRDAPFQTDLNLKLAFLEDQLIGGLVYSIGTTSKVGFLIGTRINNLRLSYSYDVGLIDFQQYNNGSHEITVGLKIDQKPKRVKLEDVDPNQ